MWIIRTAKLFAKARKSLKLLYSIVFTAVDDVNIHDEDDANDANNAVAAKTFMVAYMYVVNAYNRQI